MELPMMQPRQPQTSGGRVRSSPPTEAETSGSSKRAATVALALKEKIGFPTYAAFLEKNHYGYLRSVTESTHLRNCHQDLEPHCAIIDLSRERVSLRCANLSALQTLSALCEPPQHVSVQVVLLSVPHKEYLGLATEFPSLLGLGLKLTPQFFGALTAQLEGYSNFEISSNAHFRCKYLLASGTVVAIARRFELAKPESPSIVLFAGPPRIHDLVDQSALYEMLYDAPTIHESVHEDRSPRGDDPDSEGAVYYARLLSYIMKQNQDCTHDCDDLLLASLIPLLKLDILRVQKLCSVVRDYFVKLKSPTYKNNGQELTDRLVPSPGDDETPERLYRYRTILRSVIEQFEDEAEPLKTFVSSQIGEHLMTSATFIQIEKDRHWVLKETCRLEAEIRDYLQVQAGHLALLESRKTIELSNYQIQEGERGRL